MIAGYRARADAADVVEEVVVEVEPENRDAFRLFRSMQTQWNTQSLVAGSKLVTIRTGLNYAALPAVRDELGISPAPHTMEAIRLMETEALAIHSRRQTAALRRR